MSDLEARVKALEDTLQRITQALLAPPAPTKPTPRPTSLDLPEDIAQYLSLNPDGTVTQEYIHDQALYVKVRDIMKQLGYTWISAGKESHWRKA